jgi:hypothetical protein
MIFPPRNMVPVWIGLAFFVLGLLVLWYGNGYRAERKEQVSETEVLVKVFFSNTQFDPQTLNCDKTYPAYRMAELSQKIKVDAFVESPSEELAKKIYYAVNGLLTGVTKEEEKEGYFSSINPLARINKIVVEGDTAYADFSRELNEGAAGSCKVSAIRSQIENTLKQFPEINKVVISVNGDSETILQP